MTEEVEIKEVRSILVPFVVGGLVGAGIALLLAPKAGKDLREDIKDMASDARDKITTTVDKGKGLYIEGTEAIKHAFEAGKTAYTEEMGKHRKVA